MDRRRALPIAISLVLFVFVLGALIGGIDSLQVSPGRVLPAREEEALPAHEPQPATSLRLGSASFVSILIPIALALLAISVLLAIRDRRLRPALAASLLLFALVVLMLYLIGPFAPADRTLLEEEEEVVVGPTAGPPAEEAPIRVETQPASSREIWPIITTGVLAVLLIGLLTVLVVLHLIRRRRAKHLPADAAGIEEIAADAVREIDDGADPVSVVQRCYARMARALSKRAGLDPVFRTPREFAADLREVGFAYESVDALTEMFELVRYGGRADERFAMQARSSLAALRLGRNAG